MVSEAKWCLFSLCKHMHCYSRICIHVFRALFPMPQHLSSIFLPEWSFWPKYLVLLSCFNNFSSSEAEVATAKALRGQTGSRSDNWTKQIRWGLLQNGDIRACQMWENVARTSRSSKQTGNPDFMWNGLAFKCQQIIHHVLKHGISQTSHLCSLWTINLWTLT